MRCDLHIWCETTYPMALMKPKQSGSSGGSSSTYIESHDVRNFSLKAFSAKKQ